MCRVPMACFEIDTKNKEHRSCIASSPLVYDEADNLFKKISYSSQNKSLSYISHLPLFVAHSSTQNIVPIT